MSHSERAKQLCLGCAGCSYALFRGYILYTAELVDMMTNDTLSLTLVVSCEGSSRDIRAKSWNSIGRAPAIPGDACLSTAPQTGQGDFWQDRREPSRVA